MAYFLLSFVIVLFLLLVVLFIRLLRADSEAVEIDLRDIEGRGWEVSKTDVERQELQS